MNHADIAAVTRLVDPEVWLVTAHAGIRRGGLIATFVRSASIVPAMPRMLVGLARHHHTWDLIESSNSLALHLLGEEQIELVSRFGLESGRDVDKLDGLALEEGPAGSPILRDSLAWLDGRVEARLDTGDRTVYLVEVVAGRVNRPGAPLHVRRLVELAPPSLLKKLKELSDADSRTDAEAIRAWRQKKGTGPG